MAGVSKGLEGIVAAETRLGEVKGAEGILFYCGYDINELAGKVTYVSRSSAIYHLLEHDLHHGGEISLILGMNGLQGPDL